MAETFLTWLDALEQRHLADLRVPEVTRALRALSVDYVHRRARVAHEALAGRGKRAAFALYYGPLHFMVVRDIARQLAVEEDHFSQIVDLGCGTGAAGAALASIIRSRPLVLGIDRQGWTLQEAAFTYGHFQVAHRVSRGDVRRLNDSVIPQTLIVAAYTVNELDEAARARLLGSLRDLLRDGATLLVVEPIARRVTPWWSTWCATLEPYGARDDDWRFTEPLPAPLRRWARAAGLDHRERTARSLFVPRQLRS